MSSLVPISFLDTDMIKNQTLHLSYHFEKVSLEKSPPDSGLNGSVISGIKTLKFKLNEVVSNPSISISIDRETTLFIVDTLHITDTFPYKTTKPGTMALVLEGYNQKDVLGEKILVFIPLMSTISEGNNPFIELESDIVSREGTKIDLNKFIPKENFSHYKYKDETIVYHLVYFDKSILKPTIVTTTQTVDSKIKVPINTYTSTTAKPKVNTSASPPVERPGMNGTFEDNIYIDCVPVESKEKPKSYLKIDPTYSGFNPNDIIELCKIFFIIIIIILIVYGIYSLYLKYGIKDTTSPQPVTRV
jgi:hypothetical protein